MAVIGAGIPVVMIPGIQGRWEWLAPAIDRMRPDHRILTFSLGDPLREFPAEAPFDAWVTAIDRLLEQAGEAHAALIGVSFGGLIALRYAARRPGRVASLVLVATPAPDARFDRRTEGYLRHPWLASPLFAVRAAVRLGRELVAARPNWPARASLAAAYLARLVTAPSSPAAMASWALAWQRAGLSADCARVIAPTLVVTGERERDEVVPVDGTLEYLRRIGDARHVVIEGTGHIGVVTKPDRFRDLVAPFVRTAHDAVAAGIPTKRHAS
jgi:pimeloyl-ACP methyl ester carboxylesterase